MSGELVRVDSGPLLTDKARAADILAGLGVPVPPTLIAHGISSDLLEACRSLKGVTDQTELFVRLSFSADRYPHNYGRKAHLSSLMQHATQLAQDAAVAGVSDWDLVIQPTQVFEWSGAALLRGELILLERVVGHSERLLRRGRLDERLLVHRQGAVVHRQQGTSVQTLPDTIIDQLRNWFYRLDAVVTGAQSVVCELGKSDGELRFVDFKTLDSAAFPGLDRGRIIYPFAVCKDDRVAESVELPNFDWPEYDLIPLAETHGGVHVGQGAVLSHLAVRMAEVGAPCDLQESGVGVF